LHVWWQEQSAKPEARGTGTQRAGAPERSVTPTKPLRAAPSSGARVPRLAFCSDRSRPAAPPHCRAAAGQRAAECDTWQRPSPRLDDRGRSPP